MSKRLIISIILILLAGGVLLVDRGIIGGTLAPFLLVAMLLLWILPANLFTRNSLPTGSTSKNLLQAFLGIGLGLFAAVALAFFIPSQMFSWVIIAIGVVIIAWTLIRLLR